MAGLAIFGGTFDPIHNAHLAVAQSAAEICTLERVLFVPSSRPPHRHSGPFASYEDRYQMVALACQQNPRFEPSRLEERAGTSYTIDTVENLREQNLRQPLSFLIGADAFAEIHTWHRWKELIRLVTFIVVSRPDAVYAVPEGASVQRLETVHLAISSTEIRQKLAAREWDIPVPSSVKQYISQHHLYQS